MRPLGSAVSVPAVGRAPQPPRSVDTQSPGNLVPWELVTEKGTGVLCFWKRPSPASEGFSQLGVGGCRWLVTRDSWARSPCRAPGNGPFSMGLRGEGFGARSLGNSRACDALEEAELLHKPPDEHCDVSVNPEPWASRALSSPLDHTS